MRYRWALVLPCGIALASLMRPVFAQERTQWDGVFTPEQATQGEAVYAKSCATCHGTDLAGVHDAPPLAGKGFGMNWDTVTLDRLVDRIKVSMPATSPGSLSRRQAAIVVAFLLQRSGAPPGATALPLEPDMLKSITFVAVKPDAR